MSDEMIGVQPVASNEYLLEQSRRDQETIAALTARLAAAEAVVEAAGELEFLDEPCSHLPLEMIDGVMEACDVCALRHALATYRKTTGSQQEAPK